MDEKIVKEIGHKFPPEVSRTNKHISYLLRQTFYIEIHVITPSTSFILCLFLFHSFNIAF